jgi:NAD(P)H-dependent flavin oxidoreductase YrpB (nitropropane dioxygenase family)
VADHSGSETDPVVCERLLAASSSAKEAGARELATYFVGQGVGLMTKVRPARQVVEDMVREYLSVAERFAQQLGS